MSFHRERAPSPGEVALWYRDRRFPSPEHETLHLEVSWRQATCDAAKVSNDDCSECALRFLPICFGRCHHLQACEQAPHSPKGKATSQTGPAFHTQFSQDAAQPQGEKVGFRPRPGFSWSPSIRWALNRQTQTRTIRRPIPTIRPASERLLPSEMSRTALALRTRPEGMVGERVHRLSSLRSSSVRATVLGDFRPRMCQLLPGSWFQPGLQQMRGNVH